MSKAPLKSWPENSSNHSQTWSTTTQPPNQIVYSEHASAIVAKAVELAQQSRRFALITPLAIEGGAARDAKLSSTHLDRQRHLYIYLCSSVSFGSCRSRRDIQGHVFKAMAQAGHSTRFDVAMLSPDVDDLKAVSALSSHRVQHLTTPDSEPRLGLLDAHSAFLMLFHDHDWEPQLLKAALTTPAHFIGSFGSHRTHEMRLETLRKLGVENAVLDRLRGPIGLVPSLRNASFIAVSTLSEIVNACPQTTITERSS